MNHHFPLRICKRALLPLFIFSFGHLAPSSFSEPFFSLYLLLFLSLLHLSSDYSKPLGACGGHKVVTQRERWTWKKKKKNRWIEWIPYREGRNYASPDLLKYYSSLPPVFPLSNVWMTDWTQRADLTHWIIDVCLALVGIKHLLTVRSCSAGSFTLWENLLMLQKSCYTVQCNFFCSMPWT